MKIQNPPNRRTLAAFLALSAIAIGSIPVRAQDLVQDTLAVRILLDQNGLTATPVAQVAQIDPSVSRITALRLSGLKLTGLPPQISSLTALKYLVASDNLLDSLPAAVWSLANLVELDLGGNRIQTLDPRVSQLQALLLLGLRGNSLLAVPASLFTLPHLETLLLAANSLDTLPEAVADMAFLKYLDVSQNVLRTVPFTMAAMDGLDTLDLSSNVMESLPDLSGLKPAAKVRIAANRLCNMGAQQQAWADGKEPGWKATQVCGSAVRPQAARALPKGLRAFSADGFVRFDLSGAGDAGLPRELILRDAGGRELLRKSVAAGTEEMFLPRAGLGRGMVWAEVRGGGEAFSTVVAP